MQPPRRHATYYGAIALLDRLPARGCAANSATLYARVFRNMWSEPVLVPSHSDYDSLDVTG
jgi:hypothetical protein